MVILAKIGRIKKEFYGKIGGNEVFNDWKESQKEKVKDVEEHYELLTK